MDDAMVTARMSPAKKEAGRALLEQLGTTPSQAINMLYDYIAEHEQLPFDTADSAPGAFTAAELAEARTWLHELALPHDNRFSTMTDDEIRTERLAAKGILEGAW